jgi:hypothetical protein
MKRMILTATLAAALAAPLSAQNAEEEAPSLMERGMQLFFEGLKQEMEPALRDLEDLAGELEPAMRSFVEEMGPALEGLMDDVRDWSAYHPPERLPNGDIILRRKSPEEMDPPETAPESPPDAPREIDI